MSVNIVYFIQTLQTSQQLNFVNKNIETFPEIHLCTFKTQFYYNNK